MNKVVSVLFAFVNLGRKKRPAALSQKLRLVAEDLLQWLAGGRKVGRFLIDKVCSVFGVFFLLKVFHGYLCYIIVFENGF